MGKYAVTELCSPGETKQTWEQLSTLPLGNLESLEMAQTIGSEAKKWHSSWRPKNVQSQMVPRRINAVTQGLSHLVEEFAYHFIHLHR